MKRNLVFVSHSASTLGAERGLLELASGLVERGHRIHVLLPREGPLLALLEQSSVPARVVPFRGWATRERRLGRHLRAVTRQVGSVRRVRRVLSELRPEAVVTNTLTVPSGAVAARLLGLPHIWYLREFGVLDHGFRFDLGFRNSIRVVDRLSDRVIVNCKTLHDYFSEWIAPEKLPVVYNGVELGVDDAAIERWRAERGEGREGLRCLMVGRISATKGQSDAVRALALLKQRGVEVRLSLVGGGEADEIGALRELGRELDVADRLEFVGYSNEPLEQMCRGDVALVCSRQEAFGRVTVEALKVGLPVIASRVGGLVEHVRDGEDGFLYAPGDVEQLADRVELLARDEGLRERLGRNAARDAKRRYSLERQVAEFLAVVDEVTST